MKNRKGYGDLKLNGLIKPIRNSQFAITFCDGDLDPDTKRAAYLAGDLNPQSSLIIGLPMATPSSVRAKFLE
ncbi:hypothetical protein NIES4072_38010 [Nostoc commune NIES-4072]|uniref:Uncharacterized protein n=1 Tax=Nostoc commune NIES-4072 TaxID=2005467 RepID=A0A2R5FMX7_NOSCO|nr:hypothetical protein NIES4070_52750 [Nostoc commune HK-02]GBG20127.1 hypothetical protein NIES4072_38010 [Nostoc commune NIES-4072]